MDGTEIHLRENVQGDWDTSTVQMEELLAEDRGSPDETKVCNNRKIQVLPAYKTFGKQNTILLAVVSILEHLFRTVFSSFQSFFHFSCHQLNKDKSTLIRTRQKGF